MYLQLRNFFRSTALYTIGSLLYRGASFLLVPLYVHKLSPSEYGTLELIVVTNTIVQTAFGAGIAHSALRFYFEYSEASERNKVISTVLLGSLAAASLGAIAMCLAAPALSSFILSTRAYALPFRLLAISMVFEVSREISLALVRAQERAGFFILTSTLQLLVQVAACLYTVVYLNLGVVGVVLGNLTANAVIWAFLTTSTVRTCGLGFDPKKLRPVLSYASPLMVSAVSWAIFQSLDRYFLNAYKGLADAGIFSLALRVATIIPVLLVTPFTNSYGPFRFSIMKQANAA